MLFQGTLRKREGGILKYLKKIRSLRSTTSYYYEVLVKTYWTKVSRLLLGEHHSMNSHQLIRNHYWENVLGEVPGLVGAERKCAGIHW